MNACDECLRRAWLLGVLAGHLERGRRTPGVLALDDASLIEGYGGAERAAIRRRHAAFDRGAARSAVAAAGVQACCPHGSGYPDRLRDLGDPPAALFVAGRPDALAALSSYDPDEAPAVAVVGARRCAGEGEEVAEGLGRGLAAAGVCVVSGMALGIDSAAHRGAVAAPRAAPAPRVAPTIAVLAGGADVVYPPSARRLYARIVEVGCAVSELPPGATPRRWAFPARNRMIAALAGMTVVVHARERSGSLITADLAMQLGRTVGAVPGPVTRALSRGSNALLHDGAHVVRDARDVLEALVPGRLAAHGIPAPPAVPDELAPALAAVEDGAATPGLLAVACGVSAGDALAALTRLELAGLVRRDASGRYAAAAADRAALL